MLSVAIERKDVEEGLAYLEKSLDTTNLVPVLNNFLIRTIPKNRDICTISQRTLTHLSSLHDKEITKKLEALIGVDFENEESLMSKVFEVIGKEDALRVKDDILEHTQDFICAVATNTEITALTYMPCLIDTPGEITVPKELYTISKELDDGKMFIQEKDNMWLSLRCGEYSSDMGGLPASMFVAVPQKTKNYTFKIGQQTLKNILKKSKIAVASPDEPRVYLTGMSMALIDNTLYTATTDGHRLAYSKTTDVVVSKDVDTDFDIIVPIKIIDEVIKACGTSGDVTIVVEERKIRFYIGSRTMYISVLITEQFIDYRVMFFPLLDDPERFSIQFENKQNLIKMIKRLSFTSGDSKQINMVIDSKNSNAVDFYTIENQKGYSKESIHAKLNNFKESRLAIGYNYQFLLDVFNVIGEKPIFSLLDENAVTFIGTEHKDDYGFMYMVMPMNVKDIPEKK